MKAFPIPLATLAVSGAHAQRSYVGLYVGGVTSASGVTPFGGVQVGGPVADNVELRLAGLTILLATVFRLDVLYSRLLRRCGGMRAVAAACFKLLLPKAVAAATVGRSPFTRPLALKPM